MKKLVKLIVGGVGLLVGILVIGVVVLFRSVDSIAANLIERGGTKALGAETTVDAADVGILQGRFAMTGLNVANPEGPYASPHFMLLPDAGVSVSLGTLLKDTVELPELNIGKLDVYLDGAGGTPNYKKVLENLKGLESGGGGAGGGGSSSGGDAKTFVIKRLNIAGATVRVTGVPGVSQAMGDVTVDVPAIELDNVGSKEPMTTAELIGLVVKTVLASSVEAGGGIIPAGMLGDLKGQISQLASLDELGITVTGDVGELKGQLQQKAAEEVGKRLEGLGDGKLGGAGNALGGLLGGGKETDDAAEEGGDGG